MVLVSPSMAADRYEIAALRNVMLTARDGVKLAIDIYLPSRNGQ